MNPRLKSPLSEIVYGLPALVMAGAIFYASSLEKIDLPLETLSFNDLVFHFAAYFVFGLTLIAAAYPWNSNLDYPGQMTLLLIVIGMLYGLSDEIHQAFVPTRDFALSDLAADALGVIAAQLAARAWIRARRKGSGLFS